MAAGHRLCDHTVSHHITKDYERLGTAAVVATVKNELSNGPRLPFHDPGGDRSETVAALREILPWLKEQGYSFGFPVR